MVLGSIVGCLRGPRPVWCGVILIGVFLSVCARPQPLFAQGYELSPTLEIFSGVDATPSSLFGYTGGAWAFGRDVTSEGLRLKVLAGTGGYEYESGLPGVTGRVNFKGEVVLFRSAVGYLWRRGDWTVKAYVGAGYEDHAISPNDPANSVSGDEIGAVGEAEIWRNLGASGFFSLDASYADAFNAYHAQARLGRRFVKRFSAGVEGAALGNEEYESGRGGGFLRYHLRDMDLTLSGGVSSDFYTRELGGYAALGLYARF